jgi:hypothetical protein
MAGQQLEQSAAVTDPDKTLEYCENCRQETVHHVGIEIRTGDTSGEKTSSRGPYRISECTNCGVDDAVRAGSLNST